MPQSESPTSFKLGTFDAQTQALEEVLRLLLAGEELELADILKTIAQARETLAAKAQHQGVLDQLAQQGFEVGPEGVVIQMPRALARASQPSGPFVKKA